MFPNINFIYQQNHMIVLTSALTLKTVNSALTLAVYSLYLQYTRAPLIDPIEHPIANLFIYSWVSYY